jgi:16S rRNA C1402 (ribose-2'-O) methylase RsmI
MYEEFIRGSVRGVQAMLASRPPLKGEMVVILHGGESAEQTDEAGERSNAGETEIL